MKKVLFIQLIGNSYGGVWQVIKMVGEQLIKEGYEVSIVSLRENHINIKLEHDPKLKLYTINKKDIWENNYTGREIIKDLNDFHLINFMKKIFIRLKHEISIRKDTKKLQQYICEYNPDYLITAHYQLIDMIPKAYLDRTIHQQHLAFRETINHKATKRVFDKYKDKIKFLWLTKQTMLDAVDYGITDSYYIYNAVRFKTDKIADVINNKKLITIARLSPEKRIDLMVDIVEEIFKDKRFKNWTLEIFGNGTEESLIKKHIKNYKQIKLMGVTNNPKKELLSSSINLNTSSYEGFSLSILEANECGVPTLSLDFGESVHEQILNNQTGIIVESKEDYINKLKELMLDEKKLLQLSKNVKEFSNNFHIEKIIDKWLDLFNELDKQ